MIYTGILCLMFVVCDANYPAQFRMLRGHGKNYSAEVIQREEDLEYPRNNKRILNVTQSMWEKYYTCLMEEEYRERKPEIRRLMEGQYTELECDICPRPFQNYEDLEWKYKPLNPDSHITELQYLDLAPEMTFTEKKSIRIYNAVENLAGLYVCYHRRQAFSVYILEVSKNDTIERVHTVIESEESATLSQETEFQVSYQWTEWTECSACGRVGRKFKYGTCYVSTREQENDENGYILSEIPIRRSVSLTDQEEDSDNMDQNETSTGSSNVPEEELPQNKKNDRVGETILQSGDIDWDLGIIQKFSTGIPCASEHLPKSFSKWLQLLKSVKVLVKFCWEPCQETEIFQVLDGNGKLIECANNTAGIYSVFQKLPKLPHDVERRTISADFGTDIIIQCPGTSFANIPVVWKINKQIIFPDAVAIESNGRFTIDLLNRINLKKLRLKDSRIYSCWQKEKLVGTVNLNVEKKIQIVLDHHVTLMVIIAVTGMLLLIGSKILAREVRMGKK